MPTLVFEKLSNAKKIKIMKAAINEFSKCNYEQASINSIIKNADISRGSFYQYFLDKEDLYLYLLKTHVSIAFSLFEPILKDNSLSIFDKVLSIFDKVITYGEEASLFVQIILNMRYNHHKIVIEEIASFLEVNKLSFCENELQIEQKRVLFDMLMSSFGIACFSVFIEKVDVQETRKLLQGKLKVIERGIK